MTEVVFGQQPSVNADYQARSEDIGVSVTSVYNKLNGLEPAWTAGLVGFASGQAGALIEQLGGAKPAPLPGWRMKYSFFTLEKYSRVISGKLTFLYENE